MDMESYPIVSAAARAGVPAVVLRVVSNSLYTEMEDFNPALNAQGALDGRRALCIALGSPLETLRLLASNSFSASVSRVWAMMLFPSSPLVMKGARHGAAEASQAGAPASPRIVYDFSMPASRCRPPGPSQTAAVPRAERTSGKWCWTRCRAWCAAHD